MTNKIAQIVSGLTQSEKCFILSGEPDRLIAGGYALGAKGLAQLDNHVAPHRFYLTDLGCAVREALA